MKPNRRFEFTEVLKMAQDDLELRLRRFRNKDDKLGAYVSKSLSAMVRIDINGNKIHELADIVAIVDSVYELAVQHLQNKAPPEFQLDLSSAPSANERTARAILTPAEQREAARLRNERVAWLLAVSGMSELEFSQRLVQLPLIQTPPRDKTATGRSRPPREDEWEDAKAVFELYVAGAYESAIGRRQPRAGWVMWDSPEQQPPVPHAMLTVERHTKSSGRSYVYYRCYRAPTSRGRCPAKFVPLRQVEACVADTLGRIALPRPVVDVVVDELSLVASNRVTDLEEQARQRMLSMRKLDERQRRVVSAYLGGYVTEEELSVEKSKIDAARTQMADEPSADARMNVIELLKKQISSLNCAKSSFEAATASEKTEVASAFLFELVSNNGKLNAVLKEPFATFGKLSAIPSEWT